MKTFLKFFAAFIIVVILAAGTMYFIYLRPFLQKMKETTTIQYDKELTLVTGGGGNSGILVSDSLVLVIDTKMSEAAEKLHNQVVALAGKRPIIVINTHVHPDHTEGNKFYKDQKIIAGGKYTPEQWKKDAGEVTMPTIWLKDKMDIPMGSDTATLITFGKTIHTASDVMVYLHHRKLLFGGDIILNKQAPVLMGDADPDAYMEVLTSLPKQYAIAHVVPGHGPVGGVEIITDFLTFFNDMKQAAADPNKEDELIAKYKSWNQIPKLMSPGATVEAFKKKAGK